MTEHIPEQTSLNSQNNMDLNTSEALAHPKVSSPVSGSQDKHKQPILPQPSKTRMIIEEQRIKLRQQIKMWKKNQMRQEIRQEVLRELHPEIQQQFKQKCTKLIDRFMQLTKANNEMWWQYLILNLSNMSNQPNLQQENVEKMLPSITDQPEEHQQDAEYENRKSSSSQRDRTPETKRRRHRKRKNHSDSSDSQDSSSSEERNERIKRAMKKGIDYTIKLCHKQIREKYHLIPKKKP